MKTSCVIALACIGSAAAFAPQTGARSATALNEKKEKTPIFNRIFGMDLYAPKKEQNDYGARNGKDLSTGKLSGSSYIPAGLSKDQYEKVRSKDNKVKSDRYAKNVAKAGKFLDYTQFYLDRGTDVNENWNKDINKGHRMCKTKYDWSGKKVDEAKDWATKK
eukprot:CAMPEP_0194082918 /NCGR_PEP_ID=MMETSP0149-20130528/8300_1 /TAXON_ID=122233 /ORGANISM="Chaetoceros debilis, Strain MM31A-1" /LENGTH=161 /DNA_ID=CAMNT_0038765195 /DNA_START=80 /DNA_END=565 /DNA_ORIENTATION=+